MSMASIFAKPIDRSIEGVIKADDESALYTEVDEYVLTKEVSRRLDEFLAAYTHFEGANGAWCPARQTEPLHNVLIIEP